MPKQIWKSFLKKFANPYPETTPFTLLGLCLLFRQNRLHTLKLISSYTIHIPWSLSISQKLLKTNSYTKKLHHRCYVIAYHENENGQNYREKPVYVVLFLLRQSTEKKCTDSNKCFNFKLWTILQSDIYYNLFQRNRVNWLLIDNHFFFRSMPAEINRRNPENPIVERLRTLLGHRIRSWPDQTSQGKPFWDKLYSFIKHTFHISCTYPSTMLNNWRIMKKSCVSISW